MIMACLMMSPFRMWCRANFTYFSITRTWEFLAQCGIPCTVILYLSFGVYKRLKILCGSEDFKDQNEALRKSVAKARLTLSMNMIFVTCEFLFWIRLPIDVRYIPKLSWVNYLHNFPDHQMGSQFQHLENWVLASNPDFHWENNYSWPLLFQLLDLQVLTMEGQKEAWKVNYTKRWTKSGTTNLTLPYTLGQKTFFP